MKVAELFMGEKENPSTMSLDIWVVTLMIPLIWGFNNSDRNERGHRDGKFTGESMSTWHVNRNLKKCSKVNSKMR